MDNHLAAVRTGYDSAYPPSPAQIAAAKAAGITAWSGYFAGPGILNGWSEQNFHDVMNGGLETSAYCSGWADPVAMKNQAIAWGVPVGMLDDESGIRSLLGLDDTDLTKLDAKARETFLTMVSPNRLLARSMMHGGGARPVFEKQADGTYAVSSWVQPWLNASGFGQYGNAPVIAGVIASRYVVAAYPGGDPGLSWPAYLARPAGGAPCGWQFMGTHGFAGISVDSTHYDDNFWAFGPDPGHLTEDDMLYVGPFHPLATTLKTFAAMTVYSDPSPNALVVGSAPANTAYVVKGFLYSNAGVQSTDRGAGAGPGIDLVWWQDNLGNWAPDADLITTGVAGAPIGAGLSTMPSGAKLYLAKESELAGLGGGVTMTDVQNAIATALKTLPVGATMTQVNDAITAALNKLPAPGLNKDQVDTEILTALGNFKPPAAPPAPHHHSVLGIITTGPAVADLAAKK